MSSIVSTGSLLLDVATKIGGYPRGHIVEVFGQESSGKTTIALAAVASMQRAGGAALFIDTDQTLSGAYVSELGIDVGRLAVSKPSSGEEAIEVASIAVRGGVELVVLDSVAGLLPSEEMARPLTQSPNGHRRLVARAARSLFDDVARAGSILLCIDQPRSTTGRRGGWVSTTTGGGMLRTRATIRIEANRIDAAAADPKTCRFDVRKNGFARAFDGAHMVLRWGVGITPSSDLIAAALVTGVVAVDHGVLWFDGRSLGVLSDAHEVLAGAIGEEVRAAVLAAAPWHRSTTFTPFK